MNAAYVIVMLIDFNTVKESNIFFNSFHKHHSMSIDHTTVGIDHIVEEDYDDLVDALDNYGYGYSIRICIWKQSNGSVGGFL